LPAAGNRLLRVRRRHSQYRSLDRPGR
jgi:hypothetical protein